eukprot:CAMPEP_0172169728 /NCGR_PEP_ID=MMETSP1050-20130122/10865_1 /TAXON_ID=233186 /ORGANISM="Cryptomonas curvata, Strain CCAP979/52" /LENGTH=110 /DNA_ID=CAMNT_0012840815 /DNA_START=12 /DNA_END=344 /DNA_ORIENTATION=-
MTNSEVDRLELLFVSVDPQDRTHDVPTTCFPAPQYFSRSTDKSFKIFLWKQIESDGEDEPTDDDHLKHVPILKAAMGRELADSLEKPRWTASMSKRANDEWDRILDSGFI